MSNGAYCEDTNGNRQMIINFMCPDSSRDWFDPKDVTISEFRTDKLVQSNPKSHYVVYHIVVN